MSIQLSIPCFDTNGYQVEYAFGDMALNACPVEEAAIEKV